MPLTNRTFDPSQWGNSLHRSLKLGYADSTLLQHIDDLLLWFPISLSEQADKLGLSLVAEFGEAAYKVSFENLLDRLLLDSSNRRYGPFETTLKPSEAKWRYRKLMGIFHPDKGANEPEWLNFRAEKINTYYSDYKKNCTKSDSHLHTESLDPSCKNNKERSRKPSRRRSFSKSVHLAKSRLLRRNWRDRFGEQKDIERRIITVFVCAMVVFTLLLSSAFLLDP
ncbi:MAG: hypothetical protein ACI9PZ_000439 [Parvicella sp.]|jgi:hypothetical protein